MEEQMNSSEQDKQEIIKLIQETHDTYLIKMLYFFIIKLLNKTKE